jgi:non-specific serine/threonine protein kinase/serine/threonine-protein kinase
MRAERRFNDVRKLANNVLFDYHDAIKNLPGATKVRERLVKDALDYLDSLAGEAHGDPALQRELAAAYERVGDVRGGEASGSLGDIAGAIESYTKGLRICEALVAANPTDAQARRALASSHQKIGWRLRTGSEASKGFDHLQKAFTLYRDLAREQPANGDLQLEFADTRNKLGYVMSNRGDFAGALEQHHAALALCEKLVASNPHNQKYLRGLLSTQEKIAAALHLQGDITGAIEANKKQLALSEALLAENPLNTDYRRSLVLAYQYGGEYRKENDQRGALEFFLKAAAVDEEMLAADPANAVTRKDLAFTHKNIADLLVELEDNGQALVHFRQALEAYQKLVTDAPADLVSQFLVATCRGGVARMQAQLGDLPPALEECRKTKALLQEITGDKNPHLGRAQACDYLGNAYVALAASQNVSPSESKEHTTAARDMFRQALNVLDAVRQRRGSLGANEEWAKEIAGEIAKCDDVLAK